MKKKINSNILSFILGAIIFSGATVLAFSLTANTILYAPSNSTWQVNNVEEALNSLYISKTSDNYALVEHKIGTWIDGKPIYQITININDYTTAEISTNSYVTITGFGSSLKIDNVISGVITKTNKYVTPVIVGVTNNTVVVRATGDSMSYNSQYARYLTIQYTKTTD